MDASGNELGGLAFVVDRNLICARQMLGTADHRGGRPVLRILKPAMESQYDYGNHGDDVQYEPLGELAQNVKSVSRDYRRGAEVIAHDHYRDHVYAW